MKADASESSIRAVLVPHLKGVEGGAAVFLSELFVDGFSRRADLVVANGRLSAFEIKSAADKLSRLKGQIESYSQNFEELTIVCSTKHLDGVRELARPGVGILTVSHDGQIAQVRRARYGRITKAAWLHHLPVVELRKLLKSFNKKNSHLSSRQEISIECLKLSYESIRTFALSYMKTLDVRNARLKEIAQKKKAERCSSRGYIQPRIEDWSDYFSKANATTAIPRKVN